MKTKLCWFILGGLVVLTAAGLWRSLWQARETLWSNATPSSAAKRAAGPKSSASVHSAIPRKPERSETLQTAVPPPYPSPEIDDSSESADLLYEPFISTPDTEVQHSGDFVDADAESLATPPVEETTPMDTGPYEPADPTHGPFITTPDTRVQDSGNFVDADAESLATPPDDEITPMDTGPYIEADLPQN